MKRVTYWNDEYGCWSYHCSSGDAAKLLAAYEETGLEPEEYKKHADALKKLDIEHMHDLLLAEHDGRLVVLEPSAKEGEKKPPCFYNDMGQDLCLGFGRGWEDDEPIDRCKECWYCEANRTLRKEAEAELAEKGERA